MSSTIQQTQSIPELPHASLHEDCEQTVLILHGAFSSHATWKPIHAQLTTYHLLMPSLPHHAEATDVGPLTLDRTSALLAHLVRTRAHGAKAHLVGHSFGANVGLHFATRNPDLVRSVLVSGTGGLPRSALLPYGLFLDGVVSRLLPDRLIEYLIDVSEEWKGFESFGDIRSLALCREIADILSMPIEELLPTDVRAALADPGVRVLAVAATKSGILPTDDRVPRAKEMSRLVKGISAEVPTMRHAWHIQAPGLFGRAIAAWVQDQALPSEFTLLSLE